MWEIYDYFCDHCVQFSRRSSKSLTYAVEQNLRRQMCCSLHVKIDLTEVAGAVDFGVLNVGHVDALNLSKRD